MIPNALDYVMDGVCNQITLAMRDLRYILCHLFDRNHNRRTH